MKRSTKFRIISSIAFIVSLVILILVFGWNHGILTFTALMAFGWGMNLENNTNRYKL